MKTVTTTEEIKKIVASYFRVSLIYLDKNSRQHDIVFPRQIAHYFCREYKTGKLSKIGFVIGRKDHATVIHSHKVICDMIDTKYLYEGKFVYEIIDDIRLYIENKICRDIINSRTYPRRHSVINYDFSTYTTEKVKLRNPSSSKIVNKKLIVSC